MSLPYQLDRVITIGAPRETVFSFFTDNARWAAWWGKGSTIDSKGQRGGIVDQMNPETAVENLLQLAGVASRIDMKTQSRLKDRVKLTAAS